MIFISLKINIFRAKTMGKTGKVLGVRDQQRTHIFEKECCCLHAETENTKLGGLAAL